MSSRLSRATLPSLRPLLGAGLALALVIALASSFGPMLLWNRTESEPLGLYARTGQAPDVGSLIAFPAPAAAFPYADGRMGYLRHMPILKQVAAAEGDLVCTQGSSLAVNGRRLAPIYTVDLRGRRLPQWRGCRRLGPGEFFVFSNRIPNSFDSRYYGPVSAQQVLGVYRPLWGASEAPGAL
ncbi:MAG: S26 family signal peptidase [Phenylobacterium sp.]|uniref:S26 family signal peptidase n=1 Tax=Phenylobacterium sp. TaxID=1871053 RepID=UPI0011F891A0|nr:S26 family signal peptidase [Phenylobacterium sp.]TAL31274.1 MAG: S26 family signal peptidase [Phenylobacterium sp.]